MPDRKELLQDFYAKYAPDQELTDERLNAINVKYGDDNKKLLSDFYSKYAPDQELSDERYIAIENKYNLKKKEPTIPPLGQAFKLGGESTPQLPLTSQSRLGEKFDYSKNVDRANAISTDIGKINTDLAKHKKTIDFYQKDYLKNQGYNDLSTKGQALKAELDKFDIGGFNKNLEKTKNDLVAMENKVKDYDRLVNEKNQLPESVFENYQKDLALYKNKVNDYNTIVNDPEYQKYFKGSNELHDIYSKQNDIAKNLKTNPEYQEALAKYNEGVIKIKGGINEFNKISTDLKSYHTLKAKENYDKGLAEIKKLNPANKVALYNNTLANINKRFNQNMLLAQQAKEQGDDATLQKLQPILDADVNKMKILEKGSSAQKTIASLQEDNSLGNNLAIGMQMALGGLGTGLKGIDNAITTLQRDAFVAATGYDFTDDTKKKLDEFISKQNTSFPRGLSDEVYKISKPILEKANERSQIQDVSKKYNGSGFEALLNGDFGTAIEYGVKDFSKSLPSSLTYLTPVTAALTSGSMVGQEIDQAKDEKGIATSADVFAGMFKAGLELATERMFGAGRASRELVSRLGKTQAEKAVMDGTKEVIEKTLRQKLGKMYSEEIIGEMTNQIGSNAVDKYIHGKNVSLTDGVGNAGWIALFGAGTQGSLAETATHYIDKKATAKTEELKTQASNLMDEALHQDNPTAAEAIEKHADKLHEKAKVIEDKQQEIIEKATPETLNAIQEVNAKIEDLTASITNVSDEAKPILEQQIVELENEHEKLIKKAEKEVSESLQATPQEITTEPTPTEDNGVGNASVEPTDVEEKPIKEQSNSVSSLEKSGLELSKTLPDSQPTTRTQATKDLIKFAEEIFNKKFEGDFEKGEYVKWFQSLGDEGYEASGMLNSPKRALAKLKESPTYQGKIKEKQPTQTNITDEKSNEVREVEKGRGEKGNEGKQSKGKNDGQKTNDVQNEEVTEGGVKAPQVTKGSVDVGGDVDLKGDIEGSAYILKNYKNANKHPNLKVGDTVKVSIRDLMPAIGVELGNANAQPKTDAPISVTVLSDGTLRITDGHNRFKKALLNGDKEVEINVVKSGGANVYDTWYDRMAIKAVEEGRISAQDAKSIIEKAGLEVPKEILEAVEQSIQNKSVPKSLSDVKSGIFAYGKDNSKTTERIQYLGANEGTLPKPESQELQRLRGERDNYISELDKQLQSISDRYGEQTKPESFNREDRQQWELLQRELQVVGQSRTKLEQENYDKSRIQGRNGNTTPSTTNIGDKAQKVVGKDIREENDGGTSGSNATNEEGEDGKNLTKQSLKETPQAEEVEKTSKQAETSKPKPENVKAIEEAITKKSGTIKNEIIKEAADPTEVKKILDNLDSIKSKLAGLTTKDGDSVFSEECKWG